MNQSINLQKVERNSNDLFLHLFHFSFSKKQNKCENQFIFHFHLLHYKRFDMFDNNGCRLWLVNKEVQTTF